MNTTGKIDQLIEEKVDKEIEQFTRSILAQIKQFLIDNGDSGDYIYQASGFECFNQEYVPIDYKYYRLYGPLLKNIKGGLELSVKNKMIDKETKELLAKIELLS